ncbi:MAG: DUF721 domain-containing protein [Deltaproteobacteria bacterium]|nr:DUF721 domain-containing protein [Deltaproteobacteria bacterium]
MSVKNLARWMARRPARDRKARALAKTAAPTSIGELLASLDGAEAMTDHSPVSTEVWQSLVGTRIADRSKPARIDPSGTLIIHVPDSVWAQELSLLSATIVARLSAMGTKITGLRFIVGQVAPPRRGPTRFERRKVAAPIELPAELKAEMDSIEDPDLRAAFVKAAECSLAESAAQAKRSRKPRRRR